MKRTVPDDTCISDAGSRPMSAFCEALDADASNGVLPAVLEDIEMATVQRLTLSYIEPAGDDVQDTAVNCEEDAVYVVYGADAYVCEGRLLLLLLVLHASTEGAEVVVEKEAGEATMV